MSEYGFAHASDEVLAVRNELADHVVQALKHAGLPAGVVQAAVDSLASGNPGAPVVRYPGVIGQHMQGALIDILLSAGVIATLENDSRDCCRVG